MNPTPREQALKPRLTPEFLTTLLEAARIKGWMVDYYEVSAFVVWCFEQSGVQKPSVVELEPYDDEAEISDKLNGYD